jgi:hypothetical protein
MPSVALLLLLLVTMAASALAQTQAGVTGVVSDESGAVLQGVRVEAVSVHQGGVSRFAVTDATGRFAIQDLRPGTYDLRFTHEGFNSYTREGLEMTGSFVADLTVRLTVGGIGQELTVRGTTPLVDLRNTKQQASMTAGVVSALPTGRSLVNLGVLIPGMTPLSARSQYDVGGTNNLQNIFMAIHGGRISDQRTYVDGVPIRNVQTEGYTTNFTPDTSSAQEITIDYASATAEDLTGGVRANYVPREGADRPQVSFFATAADSSFQGTNVTSELSGLGLAQPDALKLTYDVNPTGGGPLVKGRVWFYAAVRAQTNQNYVAVFENHNAGDPAAWSYQPDTSRPGLFAITQTSGNVRLTWQPTPRQKVGAFYEQQSRVCGRGKRQPRPGGVFAIPLSGQSAGNHQLDVSGVEPAAAGSARFVSRRGVAQHRRRRPAGQQSHARSGAGTRRSVSRPDVSRQERRVYRTADALHHRCARRGVLRHGHARVQGRW